MLENKSYSIAELTKLTGSTPFLIRTWELRYGLIHPSRTETGRRRYTADDVIKISKLVALTRRGYRVGDLATLSPFELSLLETIQSEDSLTDADLEKNQAVSEVFSLLEDMNWSQIKTVFLKERKRGPVLNYLNQFILPLTKMMSQKSYDQSMTIAQEHILTSLIKEHLWALAGTGTPKKVEGSFVFAAVEGDHHDLGLLISNVMAQSFGLETFFLGAHVPKKNLVEACIKLKPSHLVISSSLSDANFKSDDFLKYIHFLDQHLPLSVNLWIGGPSSHDLTLNLKRNFKILKSMNFYEDSLRSFTEEKGSKKTK